MISSFQNILQLFGTLTQSWDINVQSWVPIFAKIYPFHWLKKNSTHFYYLKKVSLNFIQKTKSAGNNISFTKTWLKISVALPSPKISASKVNASFAPFFTMYTFTDFWQNHLAPLLPHPNFKHLYPPKKIISWNSTNLIILLNFCQNFEPFTFLKFENLSTGSKDSSSLII